MMYDEYEISISRELDVCSAYVRKHSRHVLDMEKRYGITCEELFACRGQGDRVSDQDVESWKNACGELRSWRDKQDEYARILADLKNIRSQALT